MKAEVVSGHNKEWVESFLVRRVDVMADLGCDERRGSEWPSFSFDITRKRLEVSLLEG